MENETRGPGRPRKNAAIPEHLAKKRAALLKERRGGSVGHRNKRQSVNEDALDTENWEYRWINDNPGRAHQLTENDVYEFVSDPDGKIRPGSTDGSQVSVISGRDANGAAIKSYLVRKPKVFYEEDQLIKSQRNEKRMQRIARKEDNETAVEGSYTPSGGGIKFGSP